MKAVGIQALDDWIDVSSLSTVEKEILSAFNFLTHAKPQAVGRFKLRGKVTGVVKLRLTERNRRPSRRSPYYDYGDPRLWRKTSIAPYFPVTWQLIQSLPLSVFGRVLLLISEVGESVPPHRDHENKGLLQEFAWIRTSVDKSLYVVSDEGGKPLKKYVEGYAAWFDSRCEHGSERGLNIGISIRVDGRFDDRLREILIPTRKVLPMLGPLCPKPN